MKIVLQEQWKQIPGTEYYASDQGRVKRTYKNGRVFITEGYLCSDGQVRVKIHQKKHYMNRLIWETFKGKVPEGYVVRHKNGCRTMNDLYNLELSTVNKLGKDNAKKTGYYLRDKLTGKVYTSLHKAEKGLYLSRTTLAKICNGQTQYAGIEVEWVEGRGRRNAEDW